MRFTRLVVVVGALAVAAAGCVRDQTPPASAPSTPGASASATPAPSTPAPPPTPTARPTTPPTDPATVFAADGIGAYAIGSSINDLAGRSLITGVAASELCADAKGASATGRYVGQLSFTFREDRLVAIHTTSTALITPSGARVGMTLTQLQQIYGARGSVINGTLGNKAYAVRAPASILGIVFYLDQTNTRVASMSAGQAQPLEDAARAGEGC